MKEIGGYFGLERFTGHEYHENVIRVNSGRNALLYILKAKRVNKLYIPRFLCDSVTTLCKREGYSYEEYPIDESFMPVFSQKLEDGAYLYIVNYYGQISNEQIVDLQQRFDRIIFDNVQAFFQKPVPGIDTVYSCRKFFGVPDGGYAATDTFLDELLMTDISGERMKHVLGRFEGNASDYYGEFLKNDECFYELPLRIMSPLTRNLLCGIDYAWVQMKRNENYAYLDSLLGINNKLQLSTQDGPYCYPFYCENGMDLKRKLAEQKIYVPTLWPNVLPLDGTIEKDFAENILPLPCDQRYSLKDMAAIISQLR